MNDGYVFAVLAAVFGLGAYVGAVVERDRTRRRLLDRASRRGYWTDGR